MFARVFNWIRGQFACVGATRLENVVLEPHEPEIMRKPKRSSDGSDDNPRKIRHITYLIVRNDPMDIDILTFKRCIDPSDSHTGLAAKKRRL